MAWPPPPPPPPTACTRRPRRARRGRPPPRLPVGHRQPSWPTGSGERGCPPPSPPPPLCEVVVGKAQHRPQCDVHRPCRATHGGDARDTPVPRAAMTRSHRATAMGDACGHVRHARAPQQVAIQEEATVGSRRSPPRRHRRAERAAQQPPRDSAETAPKKKEQAIAHHRRRRGALTMTTGQQRRRGRLRLRRARSGRVHAASPWRSAPARWVTAVTPAAGRQLPSAHVGEAAAAAAEEPPTLPGGDPRPTAPKPPPAHRGGRRRWRRRRWLQPTGALRRRGVPGGSGGDGACSGGPSPRRRHGWRSRGRPGATPGRTRRRPRSGTPNASTRGPPPRVPAPRRRRGPPSSRNPPPPARPRRTRGAESPPPGPLSVGGAQRRQRRGGGGTDGGAAHHASRTAGDHARVCGWTTGGDRPGRPRAPTGRGAQRRRHTSRGAVGDTAPTTVPAQNQAQRIESLGLVAVGARSHARVAS